jgi:hypothetical protein
MGKEASAGYFLPIGGGEREREREWSRSRISVTVGRHLAGTARTWRSTAHLYRV